MFVRAVSVYFFHKIGFVPGPFSGNQPGLFILGIHPHHFKENDQKKRVDTPIPSAEEHQHLRIGEREYCRRENG